MPVWSSYKWGVGHDVALASLTYVEDDMLTACGLSIHPTNPPINRFPVLDMGLDGIPRAQGVISHVWNFVLPLDAIYYLQTTYFTVSSAAVAYRDMTINTFDVERSRVATPVYSRWNARLFRPIPGQDYEYDPVDQLTVDLKLRMFLLEYLPDA